MRLTVRTGGRRMEFEVVRERDRILVRASGRETAVALDDLAGSVRTALVGERRLDFGWDRTDGSYSLHIEGIEYRVEVVDARAEILARASAARPAPRGAAEVRAPIPGMIAKILLRPGEPVKKGQPVLCLDAMKLENEIGAPRDGTIRSVDVRPGQAVENGQLLFVVG
jgi:biotin carboxyl carrier protein